MKPNSQPKGFVYFIKPRELEGPIKIGFSIKPLRRIQPIQANSPLKLEIIGQTSASMDDERFLHRCFADHHSHAEWFNVSAHLKLAVENILKDGIQYAYATLTEKGPDRLWSRRPRSAETRWRQSTSLRRSWAERRELGRAPTKKRASEVAA